MKNLISAALVVSSLLSITVADVAAAPKASEVVTKGELLKKKSDVLTPKKSPGRTLEVGETFYPQGKAVDVRVTCAAEGGTAIRRFQDGDFQWVCIR